MTALLCAPEDVHTVSQLGLPRLPKAVALALDRVHRTELGPVSAAGRLWRATPCLQGALAAPGAPCLRITGRCDAHAFTLWVTEGAIRDTLAVHVPELADAPLPDDLLPVVAANALAHWFAGAGGHGQLAVENVSRADMPCAGKPGEPLRFYLDTIDPAASPARIVITASLAPAPLQALAAWCDNHANRCATASPADAAGAAIPMPLHAEVGRTQMPVSTWRRVGRGDIVFFQPHGTEHRMHAVFSYRQRGIFRAVIDGPDSMTIIGVSMQASHELIHDDSLPDAREPASGSGSESESAQEHGKATLDAQALDALPIELVFDIGTCEMPLSQIRALTPGAVIGLERSLPQVVNVRANGLLIGKGEMVDIDGKIGVMLTHGSTQAP